MRERLIHMYCALTPPPASERREGEKGGAHLLVQLGELPTGEPVRADLKSVDSSKGGEKGTDRGEEKGKVAEGRRSLGAEADAAAEMPPLVRMLDEGTLEEALFGLMRRPLPRGHCLVDPRSSEKQLDRMLTLLTAELEAEAACTAQLRAELEGWQMGGPPRLEKLAKPESPSKAARRVARAGDSNRG